MEKIANDIEIKKYFAFSCDDSLPSPINVVSQLKMIISQSELQIILDSKESTKKQRNFQTKFEKAIDKFYFENGISNGGKISEDYEYIDTIICCYC